jgi:putative Holliday junction resolvase
MPDPCFFGFDFGLKRIGVAVGQGLTRTASPLSTLYAQQGEPDWQLVQKLVQQWAPQALIVGFPLTIDGKKLYTSRLARAFAKKLADRFELPVHLVDERLSTIEAKAHLFERGGYRKIKNTEVDSIAACIILEQWLKEEFL